MKVAALLAPAVLLGSLALGCASSSDPPPATTDPRDQFGATCPDGHIIRVTNTETRETMDFACEDVRAALPAYDLSTFQGDPGSEQIGEAQEKWSPLGIICNVLLASAVGYGCERSQLDWRACVGLGLGTLACDVL